MWNYNLLPASSTVMVLLYFICMCRVVSVRRRSLHSTSAYALLLSVGFVILLTTPDHASPCNYANPPRMSCIAFPVSFSRYSSRVYQFLQTLHYHQVSQKFHLTLPYVKHKIPMILESNIFWISDQPKLSLSSREINLLLLFHNNRPPFVCWHA